MAGLDEPGTLLGGRYLLGDLLGVGGSASVFEAEDLGVPPGTTPERVAVKVLHPHLSTHDDARDAFLREARAARTLIHPNIAAVRDFGSHDVGGIRTTWIVLDLVTGTNLVDHVTRHGPMGAADAATVLDGVLDALGAAHRAGLVHRDVSPANVLLQRDGPGGPVHVDDVRVIDLGLAAGTGRTTLGADLLLTPGADLGDRREHGVIGNAHYMSPEQGQGGPVRAAGDLYQAGALLYFLLTGQPPYPLPSVAQILHAHAHAPQPVPSAVEPAARPLDGVVVHAMAKSPARRYRDADAFRDALRVALAPPAHSRDTVDPFPSPPGAGAPLSSGATQSLPVGHRSVSDLDYLDPVARVAPTPDSARSLPTLAGAALGVAVAATLGAALWGVIAAAAPPGPPAPHVSASTRPSVLLAPVVEAPARRSPTPTPEPTAPPPAAVEPVTVTAPTLFGTLSDAVQMLRVVGLQLGAVTRADSGELADKVLAQAPAAGERLEPGSSVDVVVASGLNAVPTVTGMTVADATARAQEAGFTVTTATDLPVTALVTGVQPAGGSIQRVGTALRFAVAPMTPTPSPDPSAAPQDDA